MRAAGLALVLVLVPASAWAQFGIGGHLSMVRGDVETETSAERFTGGHIRARMSPRTALEVSLDTRSESNDAETLRVRETPLQASLLLFPIPTAFAPYLLGGGGWYSHKVETLAGDETVASVTTRDFGWHAGFGAELRLGRHAGLHGDYRYTFLDFGDDERDDDEGLGLSRFLPSYKGSMWTAGITIYF